MKKVKRVIVSTFNVNLTQEELDMLNELKYAFKKSNTADLIRQFIKDKYYEFDLDENKK